MTKRIFRYVAKLPFGEEIAAGVGGRSNVQGYGGDNIRQKFATYQRDTESGLDFAQARYYSNQHGRFASIDPIMLSNEHKINPQRWNAYIYVLNCPTSKIDPDGKKPKRSIDVFITYDQNKEERAQWQQVIKNARKNGVAIHIYRRGTAESFLNSIQKKNNTTIVIGHSSTDPENYDKAHNHGGVFKGFVIAFEDPITKANTQIGSKERQSTGWASNTADGINAKANTIAVFTCSFGDALDKLGSTNKTNLLYLNNGRDGQTLLETINKAGIAVANTIINGGNGAAAQKAANDVVMASSGNDGESVKRRVIEPVDNE